MKIKLAILEKDKNYLNRVVTAFSNKYVDKLEIYSFTNPEVALENVKRSRIRVLLASDAFEIDTSKLDRCGFAYLVDTKGIDEVRGEKAICKFQKADLMYKEILNVYAEAGGEWGVRADGDSSSRIITFCGVSGGVGASTVAAACALRCASRHRKTLYLNFEQFGSADLFFEGQGQFCLTDVIYALKSQKSVAQSNTQSKKTNLHPKLESYVKQDERGVYFFSAPKLVLDRMELTMDEILRMLAELKQYSDYEYIILDMDFSLDSDMLQAFRESDAVVLVGNGTKVSNTKTERAVAAMEMMEQRMDIPLLNHMYFVYNCVNRRSAKEADISELRVLGTNPFYADATTEQLLSEISKVEYMDHIL